MFGYVISSNQSQLRDFNQLSYHKSRISPFWLVRSQPSFKADELRGHFATQNWREILWRIGLRWSSIIVGKCDQITLDFVLMISGFPRVSQLLLVDFHGFWLISFSIVFYEENYALNVVYICACIRERIQCSVPHPHKLNHLSYGYLLVIEKKLWNITTVGYGTLSIFISQPFFIAFYSYVTFG